jgi:hypothetical protein
MALMKNIIMNLRNPGSKENQDMALGNGSREALMGIHTKYYFLMAL